MNGQAKASAPRNTLLRTFLEGTGWESARCEPLGGDASARRYFRMTRPGMGQGEKERTAILMDAGRGAAQQLQAFARIADHLRGLGLSAPRIFARDDSLGLMLLEDLGDALFPRVLKHAPERETMLYERAAEALFRLQKAPPPPGLTDYSPSTMADAIAPLFDWYLRGAGAGDRSARRACTETLEEILSSPAIEASGLALRDFHGENLLWLEDREGPAAIGLLDFQDALIAHPAYDLVSLLEDARRDVSAEARTAAIRRFAELGGYDEASLSSDLHAQGAQRNLRILGVFARLCLKAGKPAYLRLMPRVWQHLMHDLSHPRLAPLGSVIMRAIPAPTDEILKKMQAACPASPIQ